MSAAIGAALWTYKSVVILVTGEQPDHVFQIAPFFFGVATVLLVYALADGLSRPKWLLTGLGWLAVTAGAVALVAHFAQGEDGLGDPAYLINLVATTVVFFLMGGDIRRTRRLGEWSFTPTFLAWALVLAIPLGAVLESFNERLLEVSLLVVSSGWAMLAAATLTKSAHLSNDTMDHSALYPPDTRDTSTTRQPAP